MTGAAMHREFDRHAADYRETLDASLAISGYDSGYFDDYKIREIRRVLDNADEAAHGLRILNFGCGIGKCEPLLARSFPGSSICATDISPESIRIAQGNTPALPNVTFAVSEGGAIPFDGVFDLIYCAGVFHHILPEERLNILAGLKEKLSPAGRLFLFEHNPWNPLTQRVVASCSLDEHAHLIAAPEMAALLRQAGFNRIVRRFIVFFPRSFRLLAPLERLLGWCPLGAQYYTVAFGQAA